jgi:asparagine synthase (glutamine-hydrolysing)
MCGIFGIIQHQSDRTPDQEKLAQTARLLRHRGPDGQGFFSDSGVGLVHTRLSLLDLSEQSNQPFWDRQKRYALVFNGEIYNFQELREELKKTGIEFRTTSDTEVLLEALLKWGSEVTLPRLEGMFAFGLFDTASKSLLLARDRFGIKPLFIFETEQTFAFASEIRAMGLWIKLEPDYPSISSYLHSFSGPHTGRTFYRNIRSLDAGMLLKIRKGERSRSKRFFALTDFLDPGETERLGRVKDAQLIDELDRLLNESVKSQLIADAPVGGLCSGGVDSSVILAIASRYHNNLAIFHANVVGRYSEIDGAERLAKHLRLDLQSAPVEPMDFITTIPEAIKHYGHPYYRTPHSIPFLKVSRLVRENGVKAVLTGEGSDECFLGYSWIAPNLRYELRPRALLRRAKRSLFGSNGKRPFRYLSSNDILGGDINSDAGLVTALHNRFETLGEALEIRSRLTDLYGSQQPQGVLTSLDHFGYSLRALLHRDDTMGMCASIEARFPFLDSRLVRFALNCPYRTKIRFSVLARDPTHYFFWDKWLLRQLADRYLPKSLSHREKKPFSVVAYYPSHLKIDPNFLRNSFVRDAFGLSDGELKHLATYASHDLKWKMFQLEVWVDTCLLNKSNDSIMQKLSDNLSVVAGANERLLGRP